MASPQRLSEDTLIVNYLKTAGNDIASRDAAGIYSYPISVNAGGMPAAGNVLSVYYSLKILGASDNIASHTASNGEPVVMKQGADAVYPVGLDLALAKMKEGETHGFILPSRLAYDTVNFEGVPLRSIIEFEVELVDVRSERETEAQEREAMKAFVKIPDDMVKKERQGERDNIIKSFPDVLTEEDEAALKKALDELDMTPLDTFLLVGPNKNIYYKSMTEEELTTGSPKPGDRIRINYTGRFLDDTVFDATFESNVFAYRFKASLVIPGLDIGIAEMQFGETSTIIIPSSLGYRESAAVVPEKFTTQAVIKDIVPDYAASIKPYQALVFEVTLLPDDQ